MSNKFEGIFNFTPYELACHCRCGADGHSMNRELLKMLQDARTKAGIPFKISSGIRCAKHNKSIGGSPTSSHITGHAVDIVITSDESRFAINKALYAAGFTRMGDSKDGGFIHVDNDPNKKQEVEWGY